ncbi:MAG: GAF domain-containing protein [Chloroflexota bacterium]
MSNANRTPVPAGTTRRLSALSFRVRLIWGTVLVVALALTVMTLFVLYRTGRSTTALSDRLSLSLIQKTEKELNDAAAQYASELDRFFLLVTSDMTTLSSSVQSMLAEEALLNANAYWDARESLVTLPQGSWDNPNNEPGSIFVPARAEIPDSIYSELTAIKQVDFIAPLLLEKNPDMLAVYFGGQQGETLYYPNIDLAAILPPDFDVTQRPWFAAAAPTENPDRKIAWSVPYQDAALHGLVITSSTPIYDSADRFRGVVAIDLQLTKISALVSSIHIGETGYAFLIDREGRVIAMPDAGYTDFDLTPEDVQNEEGLQQIFPKVSPDALPTLTRMIVNQTGLEILTLQGSENYIAYQPVPSVGYILAVVVPVSEMQTELNATRQQFEQESRNTIIAIGAAMLAILALATLASRAFGETLASPVARLTEAAKRFAEGDLTAETRVDSEDEIGLLAKTFNAMAGRLREMISLLEQRVAQRTAELEQASRQSERRAQELQIISEASRAISSEQDLEKLLEMIVRTVSERFNFYHVGIFLLDSAAKFAVLRASNSPGGQRMLERGHRLEVGQVGIVGNVAASGAPRIALDVGADAVFFNNPDLPETRSEMALPLRVHGSIIGVLDVQSTQPNAFTRSDASTLGILADQVAIAIENARLLKETQQALADVQSLYRQYLVRSWTEGAPEGPIGYHHGISGGALLTEAVDRPEIRQAIQTGKPSVVQPNGRGRKKGQTSALAVPIRLHDQVIGVLDVQSMEPDRQWREDELDIVESIAERLALALENARLLEDAQHRAERERLVSEITTKVRGATDPQAMIQTAMEELQKALGGSRVHIVPQVVSGETTEGGRDGRRTAKREGKT